MDEATLELQNWNESVRGRLIEGKNIYTKSTSEPGVEVIIKKTSTMVIVELNNVSSINELHRVSIFFKSILKLYSEYIKESYIGNLKKIYLRK